jgi:flagella basal body P-ring formation protein FlgA
MKRTLFFATAIAALLAGNAYGATPRAGSTVSGEAITVGDVFSDAGDYAGRYLAPAPVPGGHITLGARDLTRISDAFNLGWKPASPDEKVVVRRDSADIDGYAMQAALQEKLAERLSGQKFDIELADAALSMHLPPDAEKTVEAKDIKVDLQKEAFTATLSAPAGAETPLAKKEVSGRVFLLAEVPVLKNPLRAGDLIDAHDIEYVDMHAADVSASTVVDAEKLIGRTPRRGIAAMKPVSAADIETPVVVKKGDLVTVALKSGALDLTMQGRAMQNGAEGEVVRIVNTASNRPLEGIVTGPQTVAIRAPSAALTN